MIEYSLLFALGFLSAGLVILLVSPTIHRAIVRYTENRMRATMPLSLEEVRAQKDMVRAVLAADHAKTSQELTRERDKYSGLMVHNNDLMRTVVLAAEEKKELVSTLDTVKQHAASLQQTIVERDGEIGSLKERNTGLETRLEEKQETIETLTRRRDFLTAELDSIKIEYASRLTQIENLNLTISNIRNERDTARKEGKLAFERAKDLELRLAREENKVFRLQERLDQEGANLAEKTASLEQKLGEIARLKERVKTGQQESRTVSRTLRAVPKDTAATPAKSRPILAASKKNMDEIQQKLGLEMPVPQRQNETAEPSIDPARMAEDMRSRSAARTQALLANADQSKDAAIREEIAAIAADMVVLTAANGGLNSTMRAILGSNQASSATGRLSLADRAHQALSEKL
jgi:chromosome segregation ATPase